VQSAWLSRRLKGCSRNSRQNSSKRPRSVFRLERSIESTTFAAHDGCPVAPSLNTVHDRAQRPVHERSGMQSEGWWPFRLYQALEPVH
jgi:hypothetical protein